MDSYKINKYIYYAHFGTTRLFRFKKNDKKRMEKCIRIYQYIENNPNCKRAGIIQGTVLPEGTIKRYLLLMQNCMVPYISKEGKGPATTYTTFYKGLFGPIGQQNIQNLKKALREEEEFKNLCLKNGEIFLEKYFLENLLEKYRFIVEKGNMSLLLKREREPKNEK